MKQNQITENNVAFVFACFEGKKRNYYNDLDLSNVTDNKKFCKMIRSLLANKVTAKNKITPNENSQSINGDQKIAKIFTSLFVNTASILKIAYDELLPQSRDISKTAEHAIKMIAV